MFGNPDSRIERECEYSRTPGVCRHQESVRVSLRRGRTIVRPGLNLSLCVKRENQRIMAVSLATLMTSLAYRHAIMVCVTQSYQCESTLSYKYRGGGYLYAISESGDSLFPNPEWRRENQRLSSEH